MDKGRFRYLEKLLYEHKSLPARIQQLESELDELLPPGDCRSYVSPPSGRGGARTTEPERYTILRSQRDGERINAELRRRRLHQHAVDDWLRHLGRTERAMYHLRYAQECAHKEVAQAVGLWDGLDRRPMTQYWRARRRLLEKLDMFIGRGL